MKNNCVDINTACSLKQIGYPLVCRYAYTDWTQIRKDMAGKYPYLSDDGFYELTQEGGGELAWDEVYTKEPSLHEGFFRNGEDDIIAAAPYIWDARNWMKDSHHILIDSVPERNGTDFPGYRLKVFEGGQILMTSSGVFSNIEDLYCEGIRYSCEYLLRKTSFVHNGK